MNTGEERISEKGELNIQRFYNLCYVYRVRRVGKRDIIYAGLSRINSFLSSIKKMCEKWNIRKCRLLDIREMHL